MKQQRGKITVYLIHPHGGAPSTYTWNDAYFEIDDRGILIVSNFDGALAAYTNWHRVTTTPITTTA